MFCFCFLNIITHFSLLFFEHFLELLFIYFYFDSFILSVFQLLIPQLASRGESRAGIWGRGRNPELDFWGDHKCLFHVKSFITLLFAIGNIAVWGSCPPAPWIRPRFQTLIVASSIFSVVIPAMIADRKPAALHLFRNYDAPYDEHFWTRDTRFKRPRKPQGKPALHCKASVLIFCLHFGF